MADDIHTIYRPGTLVPWRLMPWLVAMSYFVSLLGAITTVELLHRGKEGKGWYFWIRQGAMAVSFGLVAIWCMHFVGNRAIIMGDGHPAIQLYYNPGYTAFSVFLPIFFVFVALTMAQFSQPGQRFFWPSLVVPGVVTGLSIMGMHYVGNMSIRGYKVHNGPVHIIGAGAVAVLACVVALTLFFFFKERWISSVWKRLFCAVVLAGAVSGMHWVATAGTSYHIESLHSGNGHGRNTNVIVASVLSGVACLACLGIAIFTQRRKKQLVDRAQTVVLCSATFDSEGRILVTQEGLLPTQKVTRQYNQRSFNDEFNVAHPVFQWLFRVTYDWQGVADLIPAMRTHLQAIGGLKDSSISNNRDSRHAHEDSETEAAYSILFREQFCVAASELAEHLQSSLRNIGVLYDGIMATGSLPSDTKSKRTFRGWKRSPVHDEESGIIAPVRFGKGQALFLVRHAAKTEASQLMTARYRFASVNQVSDMIARTMQVSQRELVETVDRLRDYCHKEDNLPGTGTFLACFALRPAVKPSTGSWDVMVPKDFPFRLPEVELSREQLKPWQIKFLSRLDGYSVDRCIQELSSRAAGAISEEEDAFRSLMLDRIAKLTDLVSEPFFRQAVFTPQAIDAAPNHTTILAFCIIPDVHVASIKTTDKLIYTPLSFFRCRQRVYKNSPDHAILARKIHSEFSAILAQKEGAAKALSTRTGSSVHRPSRSSPTFWPFRKPSVAHSSPRSSSSMALKPDTSSEQELVDMSDILGTPPGHTFGGIMVSSDITVDTSHTKDARIELRETGITSEVGVAGTEQPTFADELFRITKARWLRS